jgi:hypothetical protein
LPAWISWYHGTVPNCRGFYVSVPLIVSLLPSTKFGSKWPSFPKKSSRRPGALTPCAALARSASASAAAGAAACWVLGCAELSHRARAAGGGSARPHGFVWPTWFCRVSKKLHSQ